MGTPRRKDVPSCQVPVRNVSEDATALQELREMTGKEQAPCLMVDGESMFESTDIVRHLVTQATGLWP